MGKRSALSLLGEWETFVRDVALDEFRKMRGTTDSDPWVRVTKALPIGPRAANRLARRGLIEGARKVAKFWLAKQSAIDAFVEQHGRVANDGDDGGDGDEIDLILSGGRGR